MRRGSKISVEITKVANGFVVSEPFSPIRNNLEYTDDNYVFETFDGLVKHLSEVLNKQETTENT